jgi:hypothetical protein
MQVNNCAFLRPTEPSGPPNAVTNLHFFTACVTKHHARIVGLTPKFSCERFYYKLRSNLAAPASAFRFHSLSTNTRSHRAAQDAKHR